MGAGELRTQPLAGEQLHRLDQRAAVPTLAPRQPHQRAFRLIDGDVVSATLAVDLAPAKFKVLRAQRIDWGVTGRRARRNCRVSRAHDCSSVWICALSL